MGGVPVISRRGVSPPNGIARPCDLRQNLFMAPKSVLDYLAEHEERFINELFAYVRIPGISAQSEHAPDMQASAEWLAARCRAAGLKAEIRPTTGYPVVLARTPRHDAAKPTFLVYGHYDVQPPDPVELWTSPPFEPRRVGRNVYARGISDNKGQHLAHINAVEAWLKTGHTLPCNVIFLIEGEEEVGSKALYDFLPKHARELACRALVVSDTEIPSLKHPALCYSLRGMAPIEVRLDGPNRDLHSGLFGGAVDNPAMALCQMLGSLRDKRGRITVPGFYDPVVRLSAYERRQLAKLPFHEKQFRKSVGVPALFGEDGFTPDEQRTARPTLEINGLTSGYQGEGGKTIIPSWASAKITMRLVADQDPAKIVALVRKHLKAICPPTMKLTVTTGQGGAPYLVDPAGPLAQACLRAAETAFGHPGLLVRGGGSIPIIAAFKKHLKADTYMLGLALPDDNAHSPDEKFSLDAFMAGMQMSAALGPELAAAE
jgi:acetylornithine deacetylase/succinyl-diaminopimelate desuccinylase-like protein